MLKKYSILILVLSCNFAVADGIKSLDYFLQNKDTTVNANFTQTVVGLKKNRISSGVMEIKRPNKFRWEYTAEGQIIISDGKTIYIYDKPLAQVTERKLSKALGKSPALLLAGGTDIKKNYNVTNLPNNGGLEWVNLAPKIAADNNGFKSVQIGFKNNTLAQMNFVDSFDTKTVITFTNVKMGQSLNETDFTFTPKAGIDIVNADE
ncbi:MAG: outer rane lipoprotein carrier protein LolA [Pseudomonadota bacterium]|nr:outer membrane lipoprotein chaperone LolA [Burkholderiales bacterium]